MATGVNSKPHLARHGAIYKRVSELPVGETLRIRKPLRYNSLRICINRWAKPHGIHLRIWYDEEFFYICRYKENGNAGSTERAGVAGGEGHGRAQAEAQDEVHAEG